MGEEDGLAWGGCNVRKGAPGRCHQEGDNWTEIRRKEERRQMSICGEGRPGRGKGRSRGRCVPAMVPEEQLEPRRRERRRGQTGRNGAAAPVLLKAPVGTLLRMMRSNGEVLTWSDLYPWTCLSSCCAGNRQRDKHKTREISDQWQGHCSNQGRDEG